MNKPLVLLAAFVLADPTAATAQSGSSWVDPPKSMERPAAPPPAAAQPVKPATTSSEPPFLKAERLTERRAERKAEDRTDRKPRLAQISKPRPARVVRARSGDHLFGRLFGPGRGGPMVINTSGGRS